MIKISNCTCFEGILTYTCIVTAGTGFTIWQGSAFECPSVDSRIVLRHTLFGNSGAFGLCNNGEIDGRSLGVSADNSVYTSQLMINLTASLDLIGRSVECVYRNSDGLETTIGSTTVGVTGCVKHAYTLELILMLMSIIHSDPLPPPTNVQLVDVNSKQLVFNWSSEESNCSTLQYNIDSDCGICTNTVTTFATCSIDLSAITNNMCTFAIQSVVCGNISGILSDPLSITLKGMCM